MRKGPPVRRTERNVAKQRSSRISADILFLWVLLIGVLVYLAFFSDFFLIGEPSNTGTNMVSSAALQASVKQQMTGKYFGIIPKNSFFIMRPPVLEERLRKEYPLFASVDVTRIFPDRLHIAVAEREKIVIWCFGEPVYDTGDAAPVDGTCSLIDEAGVAQDGSRAMLSENLPHVIFVSDMSGKPVTIGERVLEPQYGAFAIAMSAMFQGQIGVAIEPRYMTASRFADELRVRTAEGWEAYFRTDVPIETSLNALKLLLMKELPETKRSQLAYIDLRTENRVYYTFRKEESDVDQSAAPAQAAAQSSETGSRNKQ